jgi:hypothetical protein
LEKYWASHLEALANVDQPEAAFRSLDAIVQQHVGAPLFTAMIHDFREGRARRIYSNRADIYPVGGWKPIQKSRYYEVVVEQQRLFINSNMADMRDVFFDHELIQSLGCESSCHIPVVVEGALLGVFNMLNVSGYYTQDRVERGCQVRPFAIGPMFLARKHLSVW